MNRQPTKYRASQDNKLYITDKELYMLLNRSAVFGATIGTALCAVVFLVWMVL